MNMQIKSTHNITLILTLKILLTAIALCVSMFSHSAIVTYTFSGTVDLIEDKKLDDPDSFGFTINDIIYGSFSLDNTIAPTGGSGNKDEYTNGINFSFTVASASGAVVYNSEDTATDTNVSNDIKLTIEDNKDKFKIEDKDDSFRSGVSGIEDGDELSMDYDKFKIELQDSSKSVFSDTALPLTLNLSDFDTDHRKMELKFTASGGKELKIKGFIDSLSASTETPSTGDDGSTVVPLPAASWLFFTAIGGLGFLKQRRQS